MDTRHAHFRYCLNGHPLRAVHYLAWAVLFRKSRRHFVQDEHTQLLIVRGQHRMLRTPIDHDDPNPLSRGFVSQDRVRQWLIVAPVVTLVYCLFAKRPILDGWRRWP